MFHVANINFFYEHVKQDKIFKFSYFLQFLIIFLAQYVYNT